MAGLNTAGMAVAANALQAAAGYAQIHSALAGPNGTLNVAAPTRVAIPWAPPTGGNFNLLGPIPFAGGTVRGPVYSVTLWSAPSGGLFFGEFQITGDMVFSNTGTFMVNAFNETGTAS